MSRNIENWILDKAVIENEYMGYTWPGKVLLEPYHRDRVYVKLKGCLVEFRLHDFSLDKYCITVGDGVDVFKLVVFIDAVTPEKQAKLIAKRRLVERNHNRTTWWMSGTSFFKAYIFYRKKKLNFSKGFLEKVIKELQRRKEYYADISITRDTGRGFRKADGDRTRYT